MGKELEFEGRLMFSLPQKKVNNKYKVFIEIKRKGLPVGLIALDEQYQLIEDWNHVKLNIHVCEEVQK